MTTSLSGETAKIYQFPLHRIDRNRRGLVETKPQPVIYESGSGSWYHEEAIREADESRKQ
ncbi:DUF2735 domain-containing protein [Rhizobium paknamense]|uniref:DUF2735 domain-containing protein n=1 Tax=Rhizobium paknamense TaxID=1206817 RepID=A0ABU0I848_9HYPH|nr:DUF2735 domain-containing protein [Rhizobium paknamense]MDQ0454409.1 hypothetical protein [Rhizobium paknamense]